MESHQGRKTEMSTDLIFALVVTALAVILIGSALLSRRNSAAKAATEGTSSFEDCYDQCRRNPRLSAGVCNDMCIFG
jgi:hypothetical protein